MMDRQEAAADADEAGSTSDSTTMTAASPYSTGAAGPSSNIDTAPSCSHTCSPPTRCRCVFYSELPGGRGHIAGYLYRIADYEKAHYRPPLTALVVHKQDGRPGEGFAIAARQVGYARSGESDSEVWERAVAEVFTYWSPE